MFTASSSRAPLRGLVTPAGLTAVIVASAFAQSGNPAGDVSQFKYAPDSQHVVYTADHDTDDVYELYSIRPWNPGSAVRLSGSMVAGGDALDWFEISPDGSRVVYRADQDTNDVLELYTAPIDGSGPPVKLNGPLGPLGDVQIQLATSAQRIAFRADPGVDEQFELFSAPIDGSATAIRISAPMVTGGDATRFVVSPDGNRVVYLADAEVDERYEIYTAPLDGSAAPVKLSGAMPAGGRVFTFRIGPDSAAVVYSASQEAADRVDVYVAPIDGGSAATRVSTSPAGTTIRELVFTPDGMGVIYADDPGYALFVAPSDASAAPLRLSSPAETVWDPRTQFSAGGAKVFYMAEDRGSLEVNRSLYVVPVDGSAPSLRLSASGMYLQGTPQEPLFSISADGRAVFVHGLSAGEGLFSVPTDGSSQPLRLDEPGMLPNDFQLTLDGMSAVFMDASALYSVPVDGSQPPALVFRTERTEHSLRSFEIAPAGNRVALLIDRSRGSLQNDELALTRLVPRIRPR